MISQELAITCIYFNSSIPFAISISAFIHISGLSKSPSGILTNNVFSILLFSYLIQKYQSIVNSLLFPILSIVTLNIFIIRFLLLHLLFLHVSFTIASIH